jgi:cell division protein FtsB
MHELAQKRKLKKMIYSPLVIVVMLILVVIAGRGVYNLYGKYSEAKKSRIAIEKQFEDISKREAFLKNELSVLGSVSGKEKRLRQTFDVKREGEETVVIVNKESDKSEDDMASTPQTAIQNFIIRIVDFFQ